MTIKLGVLMDPIAGIHYKKDSTLAMLWEAERRGYEIYYFEQSDVFIRDKQVYAYSRLLKFFHNAECWYQLGEMQVLPLAELDMILMRKDPPFNLDYIYTTYLLEQAEKSGVLVINKPQSLRDANEKIFTVWFPQCIPETVVTCSIELLKAFLAEHKDIVCKPPEGMGGASIFRLREGDPNAAVAFEILTMGGVRLALAQKYIPEIVQGDKRILMINGEPVPFALVRVPAADDWRGNLAVGAQGMVQPLTERDRWICQQVGPVLREKGLLFVGLDVIGDYLTEINVTSPTGIRELDEQCGLNISGVLFDTVLGLEK